MRDAAINLRARPEQRDLIDQTIYACATRGGDKVIARALLNERRVMKPKTGLTGFWGERLAG